MPVRIYDIARKFGLESKEVLVKAKELGIAAAKVPSSTVDKISAEFLEAHLTYRKPPAEVAPAAAPPAVPPGGAPDAAAPPPAVPASLVPPAAPAALPPPPADAAIAAPPAVPPGALSSTPPPQEPPREPVIAASASSPTAVAPALDSASTPTAPAAPAALLTLTPTAPSLAAPPAVPPAIEAQPVVPAPAAPAPPPLSAPAPAAPQPPPPPPPPKLGDKVGFISLPQRPHTGGSPGSTRGTGRPQQKTEPSRAGIGRPAPTPSRLAPPTPRAAVPPPKTGGETGKAPPARKFVAPLDGELITMRPPIIVRDLAERIRKKPYQLIADVIDMGIFANITQAIEPVIAQQVCAKHGFRFEVERRGKVQHTLVKPPDLDPEDDPTDLAPRAPVVTIMGHVDHGKTTLLDVIRSSNVAAGEAGGITQHIGAYTIAFPHPERAEQVQQITFLDTPGHAAFTAMRARGANVTDIVVLVVAANDGVMPQTLEALNHAQAAEVPVVVAVNKCDHPNANPLRVRQQLQEHGVVPDEWGGDTLFTDVSALTKHGVDKLLGAVLLQAELLELKANPKRRAKGNVIESGLEPGGPTATVLVRKGTLRVQDVVLCGLYYGRVRALISEDGKRIKEAGPSVAVKLLGLNGVPEAGLDFTVVESEKVAREESTQRAEATQDLEKERRPKVTLDNLYQTLDAETAKVLRVVVKADTQGSVEAIVGAFKEIKSEKVSLGVIHSAVGTVTESDVELASASKAVVLGFHTRIDNGVSDLAKHHGVQIKLYAIIYELIDQIREAMTGLLDPLLREAVFGVAEVRKIFALSKGGNVAGCVVATGRIVRGKARVMRRKGLVFEGIIQSLRRFQDEVNEVRAGMECGIRLDGFDDFQAGDTVECYTIEKVVQKL